MRSITAHSAAIVLGLFFAGVLTVPGAHAEGDLPDSVIPELQENQDITQDHDQRVDENADRAMNDAGFREELQEMVDEGNLEAQETLDAMGAKLKQKQEDSAVRHALASDAYMQNVLNSPFTPDSIKAAIRAAAAARDKAAAEKKAAEAKKENEDSVGMNGFSDGDLDAFAAGTGTDTGIFSETGDNTGIFSASGQNFGQNPGGPDTQMFEAMRDNVAVAPMPQPEGYASRPSAREPSGRIIILRVGPSEYSN